MKHNTYVFMCNDYRKQLQDNEQELLVLKVSSMIGKIMWFDLRPFVM